jgi:cyanate lyase
MTRQEATEKILAAKRAKGLSFEQIAATVGRHKVWCTSALLGQQSMSAEEAQRVIDLLGLDQEIARILQECPHKGSLHEVVPVDPLIYRFHEITQVYGTTKGAHSRDVRRWHYECYRLRDGHRKGA